MQSRFIYSMCDLCNMVLRETSLTSRSVREKRDDRRRLTEEEMRKVLTEADEKDTSTSEQHSSRKSRRRQMFDSCIWLFTVMHNAKLLDCYIFWWNCECETLETWKCAVNLLTLTWSKMTFYLQWNSVDNFWMKSCSLAIHEMQINGYRQFESQKSISRNLPEDKLRWINELIGLCKKMNIIYNNIILTQSLRQTVQSDVQFMNESFLWTGSF